jgi:peptidoglycan/xylan/chitin deacetylase (PgdA/CDA1 family)
MYNTFKRFKHVHEIICKTERLMHVPTILTEEILDFPEAIEYIKYETDQGRMRPQLHGYQHVDYGSMSEQEVRNHLVMAFDMFVSFFGHRPTKWYTPWGANQPHLHSAAAPLKLEVVDCSKNVKLKGRYGVKQLLSEGKTIDYFDGQEIIMHWWNALDIERLIELVEVINADSSD